MTISRIFDDFDQFDLLFKNFFETNSPFVPLSQSKSCYPLNIREEDDFLVLDLAVVGLEKDDISIKVEDNNVLRISYVKPTDSDEVEQPKLHWLVKGITNKSFNFGWRISNKFDLSTIDATMSKGMLTVKIKKTKTAETVSVTIK